MDDYMTPEQAAEAAKGFTFEKFWLALNESRKRMEESNARMETWMKESKEETDKRMKESKEETDKRMAILEANLNKSIGGLGNSLGRLTEEIMSAEMFEIFANIGYDFTMQGEHIAFTDGKRTLAEADVFMQNGEYVMIVEVKTKLTSEDVNDHIERIERIRDSFIVRGDARKIIGAVAAPSVTEHVKKHAHKKGLYVVIMGGGATAIADPPPHFKAREW